MRQIRRDGDKKIVGSDGDVFDKWMQAVASAGELLGGEIKRLSPRHARPQKCFVIPILVVSDDVLWVVDYPAKKNSPTEPHQVAETTFFVGRKFVTPHTPNEVEYVATHLHIFTRSHIRNFLKEISEPGPLWQTIFPK
jgi:hypothetical protein